MNNRRTKNFWRILATQLGVASVIFITGISIVFYAQGYKFNFQTFSLVKTGLLYLDADTDATNIYINGELSSDKNPFTKNLLPGYYNISLQKPGFVSWDRNIKIEAEIVANFNKIILFRENVSPVLLNDEKKISLLNTPSDILAVNADKSLLHNDYEIWTNDQLVTRFSQPISGVSWYPDLEHIIFQQGNQIRVIEKDGQNDTLLVTLSTTSPVNFVIGSRGQELYYRENNQYMMAIIK